MMTGTHSLEGRVAIVTGAGKGLGRAYALGMASLGARVLVNNRATHDPQGCPSADAVVAEIQARGGEAVANYDEVERPGAGDNLVSAALSHFGRLDIVLSNAGIDRTRSFHKQPLADFDEVVQINFHAVARLLHAAWPHLRTAGYGRVLVSTSTAGLWGNHGQTAYSASKAALIGLMKSLAIEGAPRGIRVNAIAPYAVTQLTAPWFPEQSAVRFSPESAARLATWLVSEQCTLSGATLITGADHVRLARSLETASLPLTGSFPGLVDELINAPCETAHESANAEFEDFVQCLS